MQYDIAIIGCGICGASIAYELSKYQASVVILERENDIACGTTRANSAIAHAGYDPRPGSKMAYYNVAGSKMLEELCGRLSLPYTRCGSMVLALEEENRAVLEMLYARGVQNGVEGLQILTREEALALEPKLSGEIKAALYAPSGAVVDPWGLAIALAQVAVQNGAELKCRAGVTAIEKQHGGYRLQTEAGEITAQVVINAAGTHADEINDLVNEHFFSILPVKGEYYLLDKTQGDVVSHTIFQTPNELGKGVLISPTVHGNLIVGPTAEDIDGREDTTVTTQGLQTVAQAALQSSGAINLRECIRSFAGVRATTQEDDFIIGESASKGFFNVAAIKSPGLTAAPAIGADFPRLLCEAGYHFPLKKDYITDRAFCLFQNMSPEQQAAALKKEPRYGRVICRCEGITEGDILAVIHAPVPPCSLDGVKRRAGSGMGRCQGGFCSPRVHEILSRELGIPMQELLQGGEGSYILTGETKQEGNAV